LFDSISLVVPCRLIHAMLELETGFAKGFLSGPESEVERCPWDRGNPLIPAFSNGGKRGTVQFHIKCKAGASRRLLPLAQGRTAEPSPTDSSPPIIHRKVGDGRVFGSADCGDDGAGTEALGRVTQPAFLANPALGMAHRALGMLFEFRVQLVERLLHLRLA
jgi:hypothetical protein